MASGSARLRRRSASGRRSSRVDRAAVYSTRRLGRSGHGNGWASDTGVVAVRAAWTTGSNEDGGDAAEAAAWADSLSARANPTPPR